MPSGLEASLVALSWAYVIAFFAWLLLLSVAGERLALVFFLNSLSHLAIFGLPFVLIVAVLTDNPALLLVAVFAVAVWLYFWGQPLLPRSWRSWRVSRPAGPAGLSISTFNLLWINDDLDAVVHAIRQLDTDVVAIQELSPAHEAAITSHLTPGYPYQLFRPGPKATGLALISRLPVTASPDTIDDAHWLGAPLIADFRLADRDATVIVFHAASVLVPSAARERQARKLVDYASRIGRPAILLGDFNATSASPAYRILGRSLQDAWLAAGWGLGHTFPGSSWRPMPGSVSPPLPRRFIPNWLVRIDYIFHTTHWHTRHARTARHSGRSDHRPLIAELILRD